MSSGSEQWVILDSKRGGTKYLQPNLSAAEGTESGVDVDFTSTGFTLTGSGGGIGQVNSNSSTYIYWAIAKNVPSNTTLANSFKSGLNPVPVIDCAEPVPVYVTALKLFANVVLLGTFLAIAQ